MSGTWNAIMCKMDGSGPPIKKQRIISASSKLLTAKQAKTNATPTQRPWWQDYDIPDGYFDPSKHGYFMSKHDGLVYKMPDGRRVPATGVDEFGPFETYNPHDKHIH
jgi:hypothetical protein